jgi:YegS/Rv2252/BmrU family lipid kinase
MPVFPGMTRIFAIFNPAARGEKSQRLRQFLESKKSDRVVLAPTECAGDATRLAATVGDYDIVVAAGGDGTINEVINGLGEAGTALGILPLGTANVFAKELGLPHDFGDAWQVIEAGKSRSIDLPCAEFAGKRRYFCQLAGVGFDARAVRAASWELKKKVGPLAYVWSGLKTLGETHAPVEVAPRGVAGAAVFVGNGRYYGGKFRLFPQAKLDDGLLDVCVFEKLGYLDLLRYGPGVLCGTHMRLKGVHYFQTPELVCNGAEPAPFELDGEDAGDAPVRFWVKPRALRVIVGGGNQA